MESRPKPIGTAATPVALAMGATIGFAAVYLGLPLLGAIEHGSGARMGIALVVALFSGSVAALVARGRAMAALADAAMAEDADQALLEHRGRRQRARWMGFGALLAGTGLTYLAIGQFYGSLNRDRSDWDQLELGSVEIGVSVFVALVLGLSLWRLLDPGRFAEPEEAYVSVGDASTTVSDQELERTAAAVRAHQRRSALARYGGVAVAVATMSLLGYGASVLEIGGGRVWAFLFGLGIVAGVFVARAVGPKIGIEDLDDTPVDRPSSTGVEPLPFAQSLQRAQALQVVRRSAWKQLFSGEGRSYHVSADDTALAEATRVETLLDRLLPALVAPLRAEIRADGAPTLSIEGRRLAVHFTVIEANAAIGAIEGAPLSRHYEITAGKERITLQGSFFNRTEFALLQDGARVGYIQVMRAEGPFESLISGSDSRLHLELPADLSFPLRQVLLGAMLVIDDRHF